MPSASECALVETPITDPSTSSLFSPTFPTSRQASLYSLIIPGTHARILPIIPLYSRPHPPKSRKDLSPPITIPRHSNTSHHSRHTNPHTVKPPQRPNPALPSLSLPPSPSEAIPRNTLAPNSLHQAYPQSPPYPSTLTSTARPPTPPTPPRPLSPTTLSTETPPPTPSHAPETKSQVTRSRRNQRDQEDGRKGFGSGGSREGDRRG